MHDYPSVRYLEVEAVVAIRKSAPWVSIELAQDILARALIYPDLPSLTRTYNIGDKDKFFTNYEACYGHGDYNITQTGFYFCLYVLRNELKLQFRRAWKLKSKLDKLVIYDEFIDRKNVVVNDIDFTRFFSGNIRITDPERVQMGIEWLRRKKAVRLMGDWPVSFYSRFHTDCHLDSEIIDNRQTSVLLLESFQIECPGYFCIPTSRQHFVCGVFDRFIQFNNLAVDYRFLMTYGREILDVITNHYSYEHLIIDSTFFGSREVILLPKQAPREFEISPVSIGERLWQIRKRKGLSQEQLAEKSNLSRETIINIENDVTKPSFKSLMSLAKALDIVKEKMSQLFEFLP